eukprot:COSAG02_NODE_23814_length_707_cov_1.154605_2_plen_32_part_01
MLAFSPRDAKASALWELDAGGGDQSTQSHAAL